MASGWLVSAAAEYSPAAPLSASLVSSSAGVARMHSTPISDEIVGSRLVPFHPHSMNGLLMTGVTWSRRFHSSPMESGRMSE